MGDTSTSYIYIFMSRRLSIMLEEENKMLSLVSFQSSFAEITFLATMGDFLSGVWRPTDMMKLGGMWIPRCRETRATRMSTSFSPFLRRGMAAPLNTRGLRVWDIFYSVLVLVFSPDNGSAVQSQKLGRVLVVMAYHSPGKVTLAVSEIFQLLTSVYHRCCGCCCSCC